MRLRTFGGLWIESTGADVEPRPRPRPLALLAILAAAGTKGVSRDRVLTILWPESDGERARHALSQTIYSLRGDLGIEVVLSTPDLRLDAQRISSDVEEFRSAVGGKRWTEAAALYVGPFLEGFYLADAAQFERWADSERTALATDGVRAIEYLAKESARLGRLNDAVEHWRQLTRLDPVSSRFAAAYMEALAAQGDRVGALAHGKTYANFLRQEFDAEPDGAVQRLVSHLREHAPRDDTSPHDPGERLVPAPASIPPRETATPRVQPTEKVRVEPNEKVRAAPPGGRRSFTLAAHQGPRVRLKPVLTAAAIVAMAIAVVLGLRSPTAARMPARPVLAVGRIRDLVTPDSASLSDAMSEMLATSLGRLDDLQVIANSRMLELTPRDADTSRTALTDAARRAGATEIIEGELIPLPDRLLRLEIRRVDLARGLVRGGYRVSGSDRIALFDSVTSLVAADLRVGAPTTSLADASTRSPIAYRFYEEGLRAFYQFDTYAASRLFHSAIREDSMFAMATYYAWRAAVATGDPEQTPMAARAIALASHASQHDRLLIMTHVGAGRWDPRAMIAAESLATLYPYDPDALIRAADVIPHLARSTLLLNRSIALDSAAGIGRTSVCHLCDALALLVKRYEWADSAAAVERTLHRWSALRPGDPAPWGLLADWLVGLKRGADVDAALRRYEALGGTIVGVHLANLVRSIRLDDLPTADVRCADGLATDSVAFNDYRWYCTIALRMEGRYRDALALSRNARLSGSRFVRHGDPDLFQSAALDMEIGRPLVAADEFLEIGRTTGYLKDQAEGVRARNTTWLLTLAATAAVEGGDTLRARRAIDSIEVVGAQSLFSRDAKLHHFVRGLLLSRANRHDAAVREFRAALDSPTFGYTRINYELGQSLLALNRPGEGISAVQAALHGGLDGSCTYVTRTELHELLARLFDANGQRDSAAVHYAAVEHAWRRADPPLRPRYDAARQWLVRAGHLSSRDAARVSAPDPDAHP